MQGQCADTGTDVSLMALYFISGKEFHEQMFTITNLPNIPTTMFSHLLLRLIKTVKNTSLPSAILTHIQGFTYFLNRKQIIMDFM